jgi:hypothetical protein
MSQRIWIIIVASILAVLIIVGSFYFLGKRKVMPAKPAPEVVTAYVLLSDTDTGSSTAVTFPTQLIIQLPLKKYPADKVTVKDESALLKNSKVEAYNGFTLVSGEIVHEGSLIIQTASSTNLSYTFTR